MTQYTDLMEAVHENAEALYNLISPIIQERVQDERDEHADYSNFMGNTIFKLVNTAPVPDEQGSYDYLDLIKFFIDFKEAVQKQKDLEYEHDKTLHGIRFAKSMRDTWRFPDEEGFKKYDREYQG